MPTFDPFRPLMVLDVLVTAGLVILIRLLYRRLLPEPFLPWWAWAWTAHGVYFGAGLMYMELLTRKWPFPPLLAIATVAGFLVVPLLIFAAHLVEGRPPPGAAARRFWLGLATSAGLFVFAVSLTLAVPLARFAVRNVPRLFLLGLAYAYCSRAFARRWSSMRSSGARFAAVACGVYAAQNFLYPIDILAAVFGVGGPRIWTPRGPLVAFLDVACTLGVGVAMTRFLIEQAEVTKKRLEASEERYRNLVENASDVIYTTDSAGGLTALNTAGTQILGQEAAGQKIEPLNRGPGEFAFTTPDGREVILEVKSRTAPAGVEGIARDITERRRLEERLRESQKMEAIGRLAGGVAHDFNNLLTVISGYTQLSRTDLSPGHPSQPALEEVLKAAERAAGLTGQLLAFGRRQAAQPGILNLSAVFAETERMLRRLIGEHIDVVTIPGPDAGHVRIDPVQMQQMLLNLAVNARDAMPEGGKLVLEAARCDRHSSPWVVLSVTDTGHGMEEETLRHIFEPFYTTKGVGKGTGLGLATVYGIVKQNQGEVEVSSRPGAGTTFRIYLPQVEPPAEPPAVAPAAEPRRDGAGTILLVEDEDAVRRLLRQSLRQRGYRVLEAATPEEALKLFSDGDEAIDLLLTDVVMPNMNGRQLADRLRQRHPPLKVLLMSGYADEWIEPGGLAPGTAFLAKPLDASVLAAKVRELMEGPGS